MFYCFWLRKISKVFEMGSKFFPKIYCLKRTLLFSYICPYAWKTLSNSSGAQLPICSYQTRTNFITSILQSYLFSSSDLVRIIEWPFRMALWRGVVLSAVTALMSAPLLRRSLQALQCPSVQARCKAVFPELSFASTLTFGCSNRTLTISSFPLHAAKCDGVLSFLPLIEGSAPPCKRASTVERPLNLKEGITS